MIEHAVTADMADGQPLPPFIEGGIEWHVVRRADGETLAALDPIGYEAVRVKEAERLSFRISVLDKLVAQKRRALVLGSHDRQGRWRHYCLGRRQ